MSEDPLILLLFVVLQSAVLAGITIGLFWAGTFVARRLGRKAGYSLSPLGIVRPRNGILSGVGLGVLVGFAAFFVSAIVGALSALVLERLGQPADNSAQEPLMNALREWTGENPAVAIPVAFLVVAFIGPAVEELVFRGAIFGGLDRLANTLFQRLAGGKSPSGRAGWLAFAAATVVSSAIFAALHVSAVIIPGIFIFAVALCALYRHTGSLLPNLAAHATFNSIVVSALVISSLM